MILKTDLNFKTRITEIIKLAIPVINYGFAKNDWNLNEVKRLAIKVGKMMTTYNIQHPKTDIYRLYLPRSNEGRGLIQLELSYKSDDWMSELALKYDSLASSVVEEAREFVCEIDLDLETEFDGQMDNTENAGKLKRMAKVKGKKAINSDTDTEVQTFLWSTPPLKPKS